MEKTTTMTEEITTPPKATIRIVGTSHIAKQSAREIERVAKEFSPDIIAVELDKGRLRALQEKAAGKKEERVPLSMIKQVGVTGYLFIVIGRALQKKLGGIMRVDPGIDMLAAVHYAQQNRLLLALVDQDIAVTLRHLSKEFTFKEKMKVLWDVISAPFSKQKVAIKLDRVPDEKTIKMLLGLLRARYPSLYNVLIVERNIVMARNLDTIVRKNPGKRVMLVIGAGHDDDLRVRLKQMERIATVE